MLKPFIAAVAILLLMVASVLLHSMLTKREKLTESINSVAAISSVGSLSLSVAYYEPRLFMIEDARNPSYPEMIPINRMDFVYAR